MPFVNAPIGDAKEKEPVPEGEYELIIEDVSVIEEAGKDRVSIRHSINGQPDAAAVFHNIQLTLSDDAEKANWQLLFMRAYLNLFEIPWKDGGFDTDEIEPGMSATCQLGVKEYEGRVSNEIKLKI
jgi:hypothetical protein